MTKKITCLLAILVFTGWAGTASAAALRWTIQPNIDGLEGSFVFDDVALTYLDVDIWETAYNVVTWTSATERSDQNTLFTEGNPPVRMRIDFTPDLLGHISGDILSGRYFIPDSPFGSFLGEIDLVASAVPIPAAAWLYGSALLGMVGLRRKKA